MMGVFADHAVRMIASLKTASAVVVTACMCASLKSPLPIVQTVISDLVTPRERGQYQAYFSGVWVAAGIGGPIVQTVTGNRCVRTLRSIRR